MLPVWLASDRAVGGFSLDKKDLAWVVSFVSPMQMATCRSERVVMSSAAVPCYLRCLQHEDVVSGFEHCAGVRARLESSGVDDEPGGRHAGGGASVHRHLHVSHHSLHPFQISLAFAGVT